MIRRLQRRLIAVSMFSLALVLLIILSLAHLLSYHNIIENAGHILQLIADNDGVLPRKNKAEPRFFGNQRLNSPELPFESRYFSVLFDEAGTIQDTDIGRIAAIDTDTAQQYARHIWENGSAQGFLYEYRYLKTQTSDGWRIIFLDCHRELDALQINLESSALVSLVGLLAVFMLIVLLSRRIVAPIAESYEKQRRFITDAGHELKTPLAIISADTEVLEMEVGESEWIADIQRQTRRLTELTQDLIFLSRMEESQPQLQKLDFPLSDILEEQVQAFAALAQQQHKTVDTHIQKNLSFCGDQKAIRQLFSILLDNALKYSPQGSHIQISLRRQGRHMNLQLSNPSSQPLPDKLTLLFERFYRTDSSHNSETGGYGIGLSLARAIVQSHRGKISAVSPDGELLCIQVTLPASPDSPDNISS